jgi:putative oxidoreductase
MNSIWLLLARLGLSVLFIVSGFGKLMSVAGVAGMLTSKGFPMPTELGYAVGALELIGGLMILIGFKARWAGAVLAVFTIGTIVFFHNFWTMEGAPRGLNQLMAMKNLAIAGGMLLLAVAGPGRYSFDRG